MSVGRISNSTQVNGLDARNTAATGKHVTCYKVDVALELHLILAVPSRLH